MNVIEKVSIGSYAFSLDPAAKKALEEYLDKTQAFYNKRESGSEIVEGIEDRIAELLQEKRGSAEVVTKADIDRVKDIMGYPEEMDDPGENAAEPKQRKTGKRLYRDPRHGVIAGVCSGLANYFSIDVVIVRLLFACLFALGFFTFEGELVVAMPIIYLLLVICVPAAKTVQERWAMKGDDGSVMRVEQNVLSGADTTEVATRSEFWSKTGRLIAICIGTLLLVCGAAGLVSLVVGILSGAEFHLTRWIWEEWPEMGHQIGMLLDIPWVYWSVIALISIPFICLLWAGVQICFGLRSPRWHPILILFVLWIIIIAAVSTKALLLNII